MINYIITTCLFFLLATNGFAQNFWTATVTDATSNICNDGSIDLRPPDCPGSSQTYRYSWTRTGSLITISTLQDLTNIGPGQYTVKIRGPLCVEREFTYIVWVKDYNFQVDYAMPNDCEAGKNGPNQTDNGRIKISWNETVNPQPIVTYLRTGAVVQNDVWIEDLSAGDHRFHFSVGQSCTWLFDQYLCCCSVSGDYPISEDDETLCESVRDGVDFGVEVLDVNGASSGQSEDGSIRVRVSSPGPNWSITWNSSRPENLNRTFRGEYLTNLYSGEYCYTYKDDCNTSGITGCVVVDACDDVIEIVEILDVTSSCYSKTDGAIYFKLTTTASSLREFTFHSILFDGSTGAELPNATTTISNNGTFVNIIDLNPGPHTFRVITEQYCEKDITIDIPPEITRTDVDREACAYLYYCGEELVRTERVPLEPVQSEYCYISQDRCPLTGELTEPENNFNPELVDFYHYNLDAGTCWVSYPCEDGRIEGVLEIVIVEELCNGKNYATLPTVSYTTICMLDSPQEIEVPFDMDLDTETLQMSLVSTRNLKRCGDGGTLCTYEYTVTLPNNQIRNLKCCKTCYVKPLPIILPDDSSDKFLCLDLDAAIFINSATGQVIELSTEDVEQVVLALRTSNLVRSSSFGFKFPPGLYLLTSKNCTPIHVVVI